MRTSKHGSGRSRRLVAAVVAVAAAATMAVVAATTVAPAQASTFGTATATPDSHLKSGDAISISIADFPAGSTVVGVECDAKILASGDNGYCDVANVAVIPAVGADGKATTSFTVKAGADFASTNGKGVCDAQHPCYIALSTQGLPETTQAVLMLEFGSASKTDAGPAVLKVKAGKEVKLTVKVTSATAGVRTGTVTLTDGKKKLASKKLPASGKVVFSRKFAAGTHKLKVAYSGDASYLASSDKVTVTAKKK